SECHSQIIKSLRTMGVLPSEQKNVKLDFIFSHVAGLSDGLFCEDKPTPKESIKDNRKAKDLRENTLVYWASLLPYEECIKFITAFSCQFNKLKLQISLTKVIDGVILHSSPKEVHILSDEQDGTSLAEYLSTVISLVRMVLQNFAAIRIMVDVANKDDLLLLSTSEISSEHFRSDSSCESAPSSQSSPTSDDEGWRKFERKARIMEAIEFAMAKPKKESDEQYVGLAWEDICLKEKVSSDDM
ncbi:hypothetical protein INT47_004738, partial [Mucor saturninus]